MLWTLRLISKQITFLSCLVASFAFGIAPALAQPDPRQALATAATLQVRWISVGVGAHVGFGQCPTCFRWVLDTRSLGGHFRFRREGRIAFEVTSDALVQYRQLRHWHWDRAMAERWNVLPMEIHRFGSLQPGAVFEGFRWGSDTDESQREILHTAALFSLDFLYTSAFDVAVRQGIGVQGVVFNTADPEWRMQVPSSVRMRWRTRYFRGLLEGTASWPAYVPPNRSWWQANQFDARMELVGESVRFLGLSMHLGVDLGWIYDGLRESHSMSPHVIRALGLLQIAEVTQHGTPPRTTP